MADGGEDSAAAERTYPPESPRGDGHWVFSRASRLTHVVITLATLSGIGMVIAVEDPDLEARIMLSTMTILAWTFCALYTQFPWRDTVGGKALMYTSAGLGLIGAQVVSVWWFGDYRYRTEIRGLVMILLIDTVLYRIFILWQIRRYVDRRSDERKEDVSE